MIAQFLIVWAAQDREPTPDRFPLRPLEKRRVELEIPPIEDDDPVKPRHPSPFDYLPDRPYRGKGLYDGLWRTV